MELGLPSNPERERQREMRLGEGVLGASRPLWHQVSQGSKAFRKAM